MVLPYKYMAEYIYGNPAHKVRIPSNPSIIVATMNTSDLECLPLILPSSVDGG